MEDGTTLYSETVSNSDWSAKDGINTTNTSAVSNINELESEILIPLYSIIFFLSIVGNTLVIVTLAQNRRMRTVTNILLLNLAIGDLLLGFFCMPVSLIGQILRDFIFGSLMCKIIPYLQAVSVSVSVWTLVAISLERYFAICRPLSSRIWQTRSHAYKMIVAVWVTALICCLPIAILSCLKPIRDTGRHKCREIWPDSQMEKAYSLFLDTFLLLAPLLLMVVAYWLIGIRLWKGFNETIGPTPFQPVVNQVNNTSKQTQPMLEPNEPLANKSVSSCSGNSSCDPTDTSKNDANKVSDNGMREAQWSARKNHRHLCCEPNAAPTAQSSPDRSPWRLRGLPFRGNSMNSPKNADSPKVGRCGGRKTYTYKTVTSKKKVIRMLFVIVIEFFVCWTPLYVVNTWFAFDPRGLYEQFGPTEIALTQLLAFFSSCCNPITYCFMNDKFRTCFLNAFGCRKRISRSGPARSTDLNSSSVFDSLNVGRRSFRVETGRNNTHSAFTFSGSTIQRKNSNGKAIAEEAIVLNAVNKKTKWRHYSSKTHRSQQSSNHVASRDQPLMPSILETPFNISTGCTSGAINLAGEEKY